MYLYRPAIQDLLTGETSSVVYGPVHLIARRPRPSRHETKLPRDNRYSARATFVIETEKRTSRSPLVVSPRQ